MTKMKRFGVLGVTSLLALVSVSAAISASPREIYKDYADNGRLDRNYSDADLRAVLADAAIQGYGNPVVTPRLRTEVRKQISGVDVKAVGRSGSLPFTGVDLALVTAGAGFLLLMGWGFRRLGRARA